MRLKRLLPLHAALALAAVPVGGTAATLLAPGPPQFVAGSRVLRAGFSPTGRTVFLCLAAPDRLDETAVQPAGLSLAPGVQEPDQSVTVALWSRRTRRAALVWKAPWNVAWVSDVQWLPGTETALALVTGVHSAPAASRAEPVETAWVHLMQFDARKGTAVERAVIPNGMGCGLAISPRLPVAVLAEGSTFARAVRLVRPDTVSDPIPLSEGAGSVLIGWAGSSGIRWSADGSTVYMPSYNPDAVMFSRRPIVPESPEHWVALDTRSPAPTPVQSLLKNVPPPEHRAPPLTLVEDQVHVPGGEAPFFAHPLWLESSAGSASGKPRRFLLSADAVRPVVSPAGDAVLFIENGVALLRPVYRVDAGTFEEASSAP